MARAGGSRRAARKTMRLLRTSTLWIGVPLLVSAGILGVSAWKRTAAPDTLRVAIEEAHLEADGNSMARIGVYTSTGQELDLSAVSIEIIAGASRAEIEHQGEEVRLRAGVQPGRVEIEARAAGYEPGRASIDLALTPADTDGDGLPDVLLLDPADRRAFRGWFTYLAEAPALWPPERLPAEISDCSALLRFAYREALREHTGEWARGLGLRSLPRSPSVKKYRYPHTLLGANLFRVREGRFEAADLDDGSFA